MAAVCQSLTPFWSLWGWSYEGWASNKGGGWGRVACAGRLRGRETGWSHVDVTHVQAENRKTRCLASKRIEWRKLLAQTLLRGPKKVSE